MKQEHGEKFRSPAYSFLTTQSCVNKQKVPVMYISKMSPKIHLCVEGDWILVELCLPVDSKTHFSKDTSPLTSLKISSSI